jgi:hypothetical protein
VNERRGHDWIPAAVVFGVVAALVVIPTALAAVVPTRETPVGPGTEISLTAPGQAPDTVSFSGPAGWEQRPTGDRTTAVLSGPNDAVLLVAAVNGVTDFPEAAQWRRKVLGLQAFEVGFDGGRLSNPNGFAGPTCRGVDRAGVCAILGDRNLAVSVLLSGTTATADLLPIVNSLRVRS